MKFETEDVIPTGVELAELSQLAERQLYYEGLIVETENKLAELKEQLRLVQEVYIPDTMDAIGMSEFKLGNGYKLTIKRDVFASIRKDFVSQAVSWLDSNGLGGIVKDEVKVNFGRGELDDVKHLLDFCNSNGLTAEEKLSVHPMTLKATVNKAIIKVK
jgi:hypothetical protein